jgi:class 3 adenylate cyclase
VVRYAEALAEHRRVVREAFARHGGVEVDTQGDAFFLAFPTAPGALAAAGEISEALRAGPVQVRIGVHTGTPLVTDEGYVGPDVHRAVRIAAAGHGGQVLVSASTSALLPGNGLRDLGEHRLKDLSKRERGCISSATASFRPCDRCTRRTCRYRRRRSWAAIASCASWPGCCVTVICGCWP